MAAAMLFVAAKRYKKMQRRARGLALYEEIAGQGQGQGQGQGTRSASRKLGFGSEPGPKRAAPAAEGTSLFGAGAKKGYGSVAAAHPPGTDAGPAAESTAMSLIMGALSSGALA